jgi:hypothetical protein
MKHAKEIRITDRTDVFYDCDYEVRTILNDDIEKYKKIVRFHKELVIHLLDNWGKHIELYYDERYDSWKIIN